MNSNFAYAPLAALVTNFLSRFWQPARCTVQGECQADRNSCIADNLRNNNGLTIVYKSPKDADCNDSPQLPGTSVTDGNRFWIGFNEKRAVIDRAYSVTFKVYENSAHVRTPLPPEDGSAGDRSGQ